MNFDNIIMVIFMSMLGDIKEVLQQANDIIYLEQFIGGTRPAILIYIEGLVNADMINKHLLWPLLRTDLLQDVNDDNLAERLRQGSVHHCSIKEKNTVQDVVTEILSGNAAIIIEGLSKAAVFEVKGFPMRGVSEPTAENVVKGAKDSFIEVLRINTATVRRRIQSAELRIREMPIGNETKTNIAVIYLEGTADMKIVEDVLKRISDTDIPAVKSPGNIEEQLTDHRFSIFPQSVYTERPDKFCANILEGKVGVLIDGYPIAYIVPVVFNTMFQSGEDYSLNYMQSSLIRMLRYCCAFLSLVLPGFYVSIVTFHQEMLPSGLIASIIKSKESVPFSSLLEVILMLVAFEILMEAGIRLPKSIGQAVSIMGGLVVGDAAVSAKFVSPAVVVIVAIASVCGFIIPNQYLSNSFRLLRMITVITSGLFGIYGLSLTLVMIVYYLCTITSINISFMSISYPPRKHWLMRDVFFRLPINRAGKQK